jgi:hypothetical protein
VGGAPFTGAAHTLARWPMTRPEERRPQLTFTYRVIRDLTVFAVQLVHPIQVDERQ